MADVVKEDTSPVTAVEVGGGASSPAQPLRVVEGSAELRDPGAADFLKSSGLPLSAVVLGLFDQSDDCIKLISSEGRLQFMNCNGRQAMEIDDFTVVDGCLWEVLWPEASQSLVTDALEQARSGKLTRFEAFCPTAKGTSKWWEVTVSPIRDGDGSVAAILSSSRDVTDRKLKEDALAAVAAEMKHRLRNAFTIGAAVSLAMAKDRPQHREFANDLANRMITLAEVQTALVDAADIALAEIIQGIIRAFADSRDAVAIGEIPAVRLNEQQAKALVLVVGELATNSLKYGALSGRGTVAIDGSAQDNGLVLHWREVHHTSGKEARFPKAPGGLGQQLMSRMLATVGGNIVSESSETGHSATVTMRL